MNDKFNEFKDKLLQRDEEIIDSVTIKVNGRMDDLIRVWGKIKEIKGILIAMDMMETEEEKDKARDAILEGINDVLRNLFMIYNGEPVKLENLGKMESGGIQEFSDTMNPEATAVMRILNAVENIHTKVS